jgi:hypothetical protein
MIVNLCSVARCGKGGKITKGFCVKHYNRLIRHGDPLGGRAPYDGEPLRWLKAHKDHVGDECLVRPGFNTYWPLTVDGKRTRGHVEMCRMAHGEPPFPKAQANHFICDNGAGGCCNPTHLQWGTQKQNVDDMFRLGTRGYGELANYTKLDDPLVALIRAEYARGGKLQYVLAREFGVTQSVISNIVNGKKWQ